ncbi:hypothetical protein [Rhizobium laguerreae]|uniref:hypothetical protein n=1 Tax=Rhizobium laguerreae TaxID=1076926 RepID=UPI001C924D9B|nr:hypothetical protein [Rhizobium laguerreae]MBY3434814.1 hypothetical protein [Rhizobium laguerreae]MBY3448957.1 hypothetical protein [Rhizobium laguerreae]MBY3456731.1 hypothetical protein [Rhizobium laguerreae]
MESVETSGTASVKKEFNWSKLIVRVAICGAAWYTINNWDYVSTSHLGFPYTCKNMVQALVELEAGPLAPKLIGVIDQVSVSSTPARVECRGTGLFSTGARATINYRVYEEGGQRWLAFEPG